MSSLVLSDRLQLSVLLDPEVAKVRLVVGRKSHNLSGRLAWNLNFMRTWRQARPLRLSLRQVLIVARLQSFPHMVRILIALKVDLAKLLRADGREPRDQVAQEFHY